MTRMPRIRMHRNPFTVAAPEPLDWGAVYGREAPMALEIGFGPGEFLVQLAQAKPQWNVLGLEIRDQFVQHLRRQADVHKLKHLYALVANANLHLEDLIADESLAFVALNFPDPWFKKRHQKRRVVSSSFLDLLGRKLAVGGEFHYMSDYQPGAEQAQQLMRQHSAFVGEQQGDFLEYSTAAFTSARERTHVGRGERIFRLLFRRTTTA